MFVSVPRNETAKSYDLVISSVSSPECNGRHFFQSYLRSYAPLFVCRRYNFHSIAKGRKQTSERSAPLGITLVDHYIPNSSTVPHVEWKRNQSSITNYTPRRQASRRWRLRPWWLWSRQGGSHLSHRAPSMLSSHRRVSSGRFSSARERRRGTGSDRDPLPPGASGLASRSAATLFRALLRARNWLRGTHGALLAGSLRFFVRPTAGSREGRTTLFLFFLVVCLRGLLLVRRRTDYFWRHVLGGPGGRSVIILFADASRARPDSSNRDAYSVERWRGNRSFYRSNMRTTFRKRDEFRSL